MHIKLNNISKVFTKGKKSLTALESIDLDITSGEFICVIGPSGCGKSTLLRLIADQLSPTTGDIKLGSRSPSDIREKKGIAWMAQNPALLPWKTVHENIQLTKEINTTCHQETLSYDELLHLVDLVDFDKTYPGALSGGMQQRVALARTLAIGASLWLMDEPFAALDEFTREMLSGEVLKLWSVFNPTVVWVTHSIIEAVKMADRVIVMTHRPGRIKGDVIIHQPRPRDEANIQVLSFVKQLRMLLKP